VLPNAFDAIDALLHAEPSTVAVIGPLPPVPGPDESLQATPAETTSNKTPRLRNAIASP
jgi:hypothetical protein